MQIDIARKEFLVHLRIVMLTVITVACSSGERGPQAEPVAVTVSPEEFRQLQWIAGTWRGSGGAYPAFYEEYRVVDDSTIQMRAFPDSTFSAATDSSRIELRNGSVRNGDYVVVALTPDSIRFAQAGRGGHTFTRTSADEWTATLHPSTPDGQATVYIMRRLQR